MALVYLDSSIVIYLVERHRCMPRQSSATRLLPIDKETFERALRLRVGFRLKTPDALHLAVAHQFGCEAFWTNDNRLAAAAGQLNVNILTE